MPTNITKSQFLAISRDVKSHLRERKYNAVKLAKSHGVSQGTIRRIRNSKTWNGFLALKASRQVSPKTSAVEKELAVNVEKLEEAEVRNARREAAPSRAEFVEVTNVLESRIVGLLERVHLIEAGNGKRSASLVFVWVALVMVFLITLAK